MLIDFPENNCSKTWQDFFEKMKKFLKKTLTSWFVRQDEFGETLWPIKENALAHWLVRQGELDWIRIHCKVKYKKCLHKCHRLTTCWFIAFWGEPWVCSPSFHRLHTIFCVKLVKPPWRYEASRKYAVHQWVTGQWHLWRHFLHFVVSVSVALCC